MSRPAPDLVPSPKDRSRSARDHGTQTDKRVFYTSRDLGRKVSGHPDSFAFRSSGAWRERLRPNLLVDMVSGTPKPTSERAVSSRLLYRTIVADPPWEQGGTFALNRGKKNQIPAEPRRTELPYQTLTVAEIAKLPISDLAEKDAHLYLWTTQKFLRDSFSIVDAWGFALSATLVWCKEPLALQIGGTYGSNTEFVHFARRGSLAACSTVSSRWFCWPRRKGPAVKLGEPRVQFHSAKPEAFLDLVEQVSPGPYLELFSRRNRLGWDTWGDQALEHLEILA